MLIWGIHNQVINYAIVEYNVNFTSTNTHQYNQQDN